MARIYYNEFKSITDVNYRVEIYNAPSGSTTSGVELQNTGDGFKLESDGNGSKLYEDFIQSSRVTVNWVMPSQTVLDAFIAITTQAEQYWTMVIWRGSELFWIGRVIADQMQYERGAIEGKLAVSVTAVDGLSLLDGFNVKESWFGDVVGNGSKKIASSSLFKFCLEQLDLNDYWSYLGVANYYFYDARSMYASAAVAKGLQYEYLDLNTFLPDYDPLGDIKNVDYQAGAYYELNMITCKQALEQYCRQFGVRFLHDNGAYWLVDAVSYAGANMPYRRYSYTFGYQGTGTVAHRVSIADGVRPLWQAKPVFSFQPALKRLELNTKRMNVLNTYRTYTGRGVSILELNQNGMPTGSTPDEVPLTIRTVVKCIVPYTGPNYRYTKAKYQIRISAFDSSGNQKILDADAYWINTPASSIIFRDEIQDITNREPDIVTGKQIGRAHV